MTDLVSIIMPAYNCEHFIEESIRSVLAQTYTKWELLIVDDCSTDNTWTILQAQAAKDNRIRIFRQPQNAGSGKARNKGIEEAKGRYIAFLDSDDWWYSTKLQKQLDFMQSHQYEFTCTWYEDAKTDLTPYHISRPKDKQNFRYMRYGNEVGTPGVIIDTQRIGKIYMPDFRRGQDWCLWLRILQHVDYLRVCPFVSFKYRHNDASVTRNKWVMVKAVMNIYQNELHYSFPHALYVFAFGFMPRNIYRKLHQLFFTQA